MKFVFLIFFLILPILCLENIDNFILPTGTTDLENNFREELFL